METITIAEKSKELMSDIDVRELEKNFLREIVSYANINFFAIDKHGKYILKNSNLEKIVGKTENADRVNQQAWKYCQQVMSDKNKLIIEEEHNGRWYLSIKSPIIKEDSVMGVMGISIDITDKKQAEIAKREFVESVSYDIRSIFMGISTLAEMLHRKEEDTDKKTMLGYMLQSSCQLFKFLDGVLQHVSSDDKELHKKIHFNMTELLTEIELMVQPLLNEKKLKLVFKCDEAEIVAEKITIKNMLINLVSNAIKFTEKGYIAIDVDVDEKLKISVTDTGIGIDQKDQEIIFNDFTKLQQSYDSPAFRGSGRGLYLVKESAKLMGGNVYVKSTLGKGSTFNLSIPLE